MSPVDIYNILVPLEQGAESSICDVRARCIDYSNCTNKSYSKIIDFDKYAIRYAKENGIGNRPKSVDAIAVDKPQKYLILIEKKTWGEYFKHLPSTMSQEDVEKEVEKKIKDYKEAIDKKYDATKSIISYFANSVDLNQIPHILVFLSELSMNERNTSLIAFANNLNNLAATSSFSIPENLRKYTVHAMQNSVAAFKGMQNRYISCMDLDEFIENPW